MTFSEYIKLVEEKYNEWRGTATRFKYLCIVSETIADQNPELLQFHDHFELTVLNKIAPHYSFDSYMDTKLGKRISQEEMVAHRIAFLHQLYEESLS